MSYLSRPYTPKALYIEGVISKYVEDITYSYHLRGGGHHRIESYYIVIEHTIVDIDPCEVEKFKGKRWYWKEKLEGKYAKVCYLQNYRPIIHDIELEDGSYSYHDPHEISYYDVGWFPFCIFAPIALFCIFVLLRYFYLLTFASDERRILVFGNKDGDLK
ncbi:MAG: hypothetical protein K6G73_12955 [Marinilabiliaceae bacterium]|nr:hypothetical protein [Marinilabiliaceae bacterium]